MKTSYKISNMKCEHLNAKLYSTQTLINKCDRCGQFVTNEAVQFNQGKRYIEANELEMCWSGIAEKLN